MTDKEIISLLNAGQHEKAFAELVDSYGERLYWHIRRFVCSHEDADDLVQEVFVKVWKSIPDFRGDSQLFTWIYRIATNESINFLNKQRIRSALHFESLTDDLSEKVDADPYFNGDKVQRELHKAIQRLPQKQKLVFSMRYFEDLSYEDISEILNTSVGALKASYHFAKDKIVKEMQKILGED